MGIHKAAAARRAGRVRKPVRALAVFTAVAVSLSVVTVMSSGAPSGPNHPPKHGKYNGKAVTLDASVAGAAWKPSPIKVPAAPKALKATATTFPSAASVEVALSAQAAGRSAAAAVDGSALVHAAGAPVLIGPPGQVPAGRTALAGAVQDAAGLASSAPAKVSVTVADHATTLAAGITGVMVSVARSDGQTGPAAVSVGIDYASFAQAYGGDLPDRLKLVALPACALTTPKLPVCQVQTPVVFTNDVAGKKLVATVALPGAAAPAAVAVQSGALSVPTQPAASGTAAVPAAVTASTLPTTPGSTAVPITPTSSGGATPAVHPSPSGTNTPTAKPTTPKSTSKSTTSSPTPAPGKTTTPAPAKGTVMVFGATGVPDGSTGAYTASSLSASNGWSESGDSGSLNYSFPITVPPALGGSAPQVALAYDSGSVDGKTAVENPQPSWIGDGWDYSPGYIERMYAPCAKAKPTPYSTSGDNCMVRDGIPGSGKLLPALTLSFGAHGGQLVHGDADTDATHYLLPTDDGTQIYEKTGALANLTVKGTYYQVNLPDGSIAYFGADPSGQDANATSVEPVFNDPNTPGCQDPTAVTTTAGLQACQQGWRWNLAYLIDPHHNVTRYQYRQESAQYGHGAAKTGVFYERGSVLSEIDYGWQDTDVATLVTGSPHQPAAKVVFTTSNRCIDPNADYGAGAAAGCVTSADYGQFSAGMQDTPSDQSCSMSATTCSVTSPTFWSTRRLSGITTQVLVKNQYQNVDHWDLFGQFHQMDSATSPLWLAAIRHCAIPTVGDGNVCPRAANGTPNQPSLPDVQFTPTVRAQRVPGVTGPNVPAGLPQYQRERLATVFDELGATTSVLYDDPATYGSLGCTAPPTTAPDWHITALCYPEYWTPPGSPNPPFTDWFHKYVMTSMTVTDNTHAANVPATTLYTAYTYGGTPAWHSNDSELLIDPAYRTYDQFRGFQTVTAVTGQAGDTAGHPQTQTVTTYLRGMDQDPDKAAAAAGTCVSSSPPLTPAADCKVVMVNDGLGGSTQDDNAFAGMALETQTDAGAGGAVYSDTVTRPWKSDPAPTHARTSPLPPLRSRQLGTAESLTQVTLANGNKRTTHSLNYYDTFGRLTLTDALKPVQTGSATVPANQTDQTPEQCTATRYATSVGTPWLIAAANYHQTADAPCNPTGQGAVAKGATDTTGVTTGTVVSASRSYFDSNTAFPTDVAKGDVTKTEAATTGAAGVAGGWAQRSAAGFDQWGRPTSATTAEGATTSTSYAPATGAGLSMELPATTTVLEPDKQTGLPNPAWATVSTGIQGRGVATHIVDINRRVTDITFDALGRIMAVWTPDHPMGNPASPALAKTKFSYTVNGWPAGGATTVPPSAVETDTLREDNTYSPSVTLLDSLGRTRQTQTVPPSDDAGRIVTDTTYDTAGRVNVVSGPYFDQNNAPSPAVWVPASQSAVPHQTQTIYDGLSRTTDVVSLSGAGELWRTHTDYAGADRVDVSPAEVPATAPATGFVSGGGTRTSTLSDARGKTILLSTYRGWDPSTAGFPFGTTDTAKADFTAYGYDDQGNQTAVTDAAGNGWSAAYDMLGRKTHTHDPNSGDTTLGYDVAGNLTDSTTDQLAADGVSRQSLHYTYDLRNRKTAEYNGLGPNAVTAANELASWSYDSVTGSDGKTSLGLAAGSIRYVNGTNGLQYKSTVTGYDAARRVLGTQVVIPADPSNGALAGTYATANHYTPLGHLSSTDLPTGGDLQPDTVGYGYNQNGLLVGTSDSYGDLVTDSAYTQFGEVQRRMLGDYPNQVIQDTVYDPATRRMSNSTVSQLAWNAPVDTTAYTYNPAGQITAAVDIQGTASSITNGVVSANVTTDAQCYHYDYAGRLDAAWSDTGAVTGTVFGSVNGSTQTGTPAPAPVNGGLGGCANTAAAPAGNGTWQIGGPQPYAQVFGYDAINNRKTQTDYVAGTTTAAATHTYSYDAAKPHTVANVVNSGSPTPDAYSHDAAGNTTARAVAGKATQNLKWDPEGRLASDSDGTPTGANASYLYDADGNQLIRRDATSTTLYLGGAELHLTGTTVTGDRYFTYGGAPTIVETGGATPKISYEAGNPQGTASTTIDAAPAPGSADKAVTARRAYTPFSTPRNGSGGQPTLFGAFPDDHTFLGKTTDTTTGLVDVGARKYDPVTGRFISIDPVFQPGNPLDLGGYAYGGNDPINNTDPTGLCWVCLSTLVKIAVVATIVAVAVVVVAALPALAPMATFAVTDALGTASATIGAAMTTSTAAAASVSGAMSAASSLGYTSSLLMATASGLGAAGGTAITALGVTGVVATAGIVAAEGATAATGGTGPDDASGTGGGGECTKCNIRLTDREAATLTVGPHAGESDGSGPGGRAGNNDGSTTKAEKDSVKGKPCHTCGEYDDNMNADHQDPTSMNPDGTYADGIYPHCQSCSLAQSQAMIKIQKIMKTDYGYYDKNQIGGTYADGTTYPSYNELAQAVITVHQRPDGVR